MSPYDKLLIWQETVINSNTPLHFLIEFNSHDHVNWMKAHPLPPSSSFIISHLFFFFQFFSSLSLRSNFSKPFALIKCSGPWLTGLISRPHRGSRGTKDSRIRRRSVTYVLRPPRNKMNSFSTSYRASCFESSCYFQISYEQEKSQLLDLYYWKLTFFTVSLYQSDFPAN